jgi:hypothetical protein
MRKFFYGAAMATIPFGFSFVAHAATISMNIPGGPPAGTGPGGPGAFVGNFYQFALMIGGVLAFGIIIYGGVKYMVSAGNPSGQSDAKEWIESALLGLLLLVGAYFILNVVNPQLTNLTLPTIQTLNIAAPQSSSCGNLSCPAGYTPTTGAGPTDCVCQNAGGAQGCGGGVQGTTNSCPTGTTCIKTNPSPVTYSCVTNTQLCGGSTFGTCPAGQSCIIPGGGTLNSHTCST